MEKLNERERAILASVEDALYTYPLAPTPPDLLPGVLQRIAPRPSQSSFRPDWADYALSLFIGGMSFMGALLGVSFLQHPVWLLQAQLALLSFWEPIRYSSPTTIFIFLASIGMGALGLGLAAALFARERFSHPV